MNEQTCAHKGQGLIHDTVEIWKTHSVQRIISTLSIIVSRVKLVPKQFLTVVNAAT